MRPLVLSVFFALVLSGCVYSTSDRAEELANATPTVSPTAEPEPVGTPDSEQIEETGADEPSVVEGQPGWVVVQGVANSVNVRSGPGTENEVLARAELGATLPTTGQSALDQGAQWVEVVVDDETTGWVHGDFIAVTVQPTPTPLATPTPVPTPIPAASGDNLVVDAPLGLRLRTEPNTSGSVIRTIDDGAVVTPTGDTSVDDDDQEWIEIRDGDDTGWVSAEFLKSP
jgi:uncharacterized protein YgiM (DUF1202 family)